MMRWIKRLFRKRISIIVSPQLTEDELRMAFAGARDNPLWAGLQDRMRVYRRRYIARAVDPTLSEGEMKFILGGWSALDEYMRELIGQADKSLSQAKKEYRKIDMLKQGQSVTISDNQVQTDG